ncbi:MAG TPA: FtsQ-type POTRA domain-containing protein [Polyangia bacterium]|nr:FtsQ-type POTRA domain-containing protein [Polyangia bacterium]
MMPKARPRQSRRFAWPFGRRRNRRVRSGARAAAAPSAAAELARGVASGLKRRGRGALVGVLALALAGSAAAAHHYVTRASYFAVRALRFSPTRHVGADSLEARAGVALGTNLFRVDLGELERDILQEPWIESAHARRELPSTVVVDVVEREAACVVALGSLAQDAAAASGPLYLADARGAVFKRATPDEAAGLTVVTGIERDRYLAEPERARAQVRDALALVRAWSAAARPAAGEAHYDLVFGYTLYTVAGGVGVRIGRVDETLAARLSRFDAVWSALARAGERPRLIYLDNRARPDRVTVKLAGGAQTKS